MVSPAEDQDSGGRDLAKISWNGASAKSWHNARVRKFSFRTLTIEGGHRVMAFCGKCGGELLEGARFCNTCGSSVAAPAPVPAAPAAAPEPVAAAPVSAAGTGMTSNVAGLLAYVLGFITGIVFLVLEPYNKDKFVRFHAFQSIFFNVLMIGFWIVWTILSMIMWAIGLPHPGLCHRELDLDGHEPCELGGLPGFLDRLGFPHVQGLQQPAL